MTYFSPLRGKCNVEYVPANTKMVEDVKAHIEGAKEYLARNNLDAVWLTPVPRGAEIKVLLSANEEAQFEAAKNFLVPKAEPAPTRQFDAVNSLIANLSQG